MSTAPISLYLDVKEGHVADLRVAAKAAIAWADLIEEIAYILDPALSVRVELVSGTPGSLSFDTLIKLGEKVKAAAGERKGLLGILAALAIFFGPEIKGYLFDKFADGIFAEDGLSDDDINEIVEKVAARLEKGAAKDQKERVFRELERDPSIKGVGVSREPGKRPAVVVPREEFPARAGHAEVEEIATKRTKPPEVIRVVLISPVLADAERRWKFQSEHGEFGAEVKDRAFLERVLSGAMKVQMKAGIEMQIELETTEELKDGVWRPIDRKVLRVISVTDAPAQLSMLPPAGRQDEEKQHGGEN